MDRKERLLLLLFGGPIIGKWVAAAVAAAVTAAVSTAAGCGATLTDAAAT